MRGISDILLGFESENSGSLIFQCLNSSRQNQVGYYDRHEWVKKLPRLGLIWLLSAVGDRLWFALDRSVPAWDQADYLTGSLNYWQALQHPQWLNPNWWTSLWLLSSKVPPLTYLTTIPFLDWVGRGSDQATLINLLFSAILLGSIYGLGTCLFSASVGLWAAGLCVLFPDLYQVRLDFLLDYPLIAMVTLSFWCLTAWRETGKRQKAGKRQALSFSLDGKKFPSILIPPAFLWAIAFGLSFGLSLMVKQTALFFLLTPIGWIAGQTLGQRAWGRLIQLAAALLLAILVAISWYRTNWLLMLTASKRATIDSAIAEGDPALNTLDAWVFYLKDLPHATSWLLLLVPLVGLLFYWRRSEIKGQGSEGLDRPRTKKERQKVYRALRSSFSWLLVFWLGAYFLCSLNINKDSRYVMPYLPVLSVVLAYGLVLLPKRLQIVRWGAVGLATCLMLINLLPIAVNIPFLQNARTQHQPYRGAEFPHAQVIAEIIQAEPYLRSNLGVLPSTPTLNQHNLNYYGALQNFQVYGRQVGARLQQVAEEARTFSWFVTKTGEQGSIRKPEALAAMIQTVEQETDFRLHKIWTLPDRSELRLYQRRIPLIEAQPLSGSRCQGAGGACDRAFRVKLDQVIVPDQAPAGKPLPITYKWSGAWEQLQSGIVLLSWRNQATSATSSDRWLHDHGIGMGTLHSGSSPAKTALFQVVERTATLPPATIAPGTYALEATYLNRHTGETYAIDPPPITLKITPNAAATPAPELDWVTQLRLAAQALPQGMKGLEAVFDRIGRLNQYDPVQDYLTQAREASRYRLRQEPQNREFAYTLALAEVLERRITPAIAALQRVTQLDSQNPYAYAYLAFVNLYDFRPQASQTALKPALKLKPNLPELQVLNGVAALMRGNLIQAWQSVQNYRRLVVS